MKKIFLIILVALVLVGVGALVWYWKTAKEPTVSVPVATESVQQTTTTEQVVEEKPKEEMHIFVSFPPAENDEDSDGVKDDVEKKMGTSNSTNDTDHDGLTDKIEIEKYKSDPTKFDTDGDGFADGVEVSNGYNPAGPGKLK